MKQYMLVLLISILLPFNLNSMEKNTQPSLDDFIEVKSQEGHTQQLLKNLASNLNQTWESIHTLFVTASEQMPTSTDTWEKLADLFNHAKDEQSQTWTQKVSRLVWKKTEQAQHELTGLASKKEQKTSKEVYDNFNKALENNTTFDQHLVQKMMTRTNAATYVACQLIPKLNKFNTCDNFAAQEVAEVLPAVEELEKLLEFNAQNTVILPIEIYSRKAILTARHRIYTYDQSKIDNKTNPFL